jgi:hypothetical protein
MSTGKETGDFERGDVYAISYADPSAASPDGAVSNNPLLGAAPGYYTPTSQIESQDGTTKVDHGVIPHRCNVYARYGWVGVVVVAFAALLLVAVPVTFLSVLPEEIRREYKAADISVSVAKVINPTDEGFTSEVTMRLSHKSSIPASLRVHKSSKVNWVHPEGGDLIMMEDSNTIPVNTNFHTLTSYARVLDEGAMSAFNLYAVTATDMDWHMVGESTVTAIIKMDVDMDKAVPMRGFNNFSIPPVINDLVVTGGSPTVLFSSAMTTLSIESNLALIFGQDLYVVIAVNETIIGRATITNCELYPGESDVPTIVELFWNTTTEYDVLMRVLSNFMMGIDTKLVLEHFYLGTPVSWLTEGLDSIIMNTVMPPVTEKMVVEIYMYPKLSQLAHIPVEIILYNPIDTNGTVTSLVCDVYYKDKLAAKMNQQGLTILVPAKSQVRTPRLDSDNYASLSDMTELAKAGSGLMDLYCHVGLTVDQFPTFVEYNQFQVPTYVQSS